MPSAPRAIQDIKAYLLEMNHYWVQFVSELNYQPTIPGFYDTWLTEERVFFTEITRYQLIAQEREYVAEVKGASFPDEDKFCYHMVEGEEAKFINMMKN